MKSKRFSILGLVCTLFTVVMALAWIFPIYWITITSLKSSELIPNALEKVTGVVRYHPAFASL